MADTTARQPAHLITGADPALVNQRLDQILTELCGPDRELLLTEPAADADLGMVLGSTSLFSAFQVVLVRPKTIDGPTGKAIAAFLKDPSPQTVLVVAAAKLPADVATAAAAAGIPVVDVAPKKAADTVRDLIAAAPVNLSPAAVQVLVGHAGDQPGVAVSVLGTIEAVYGSDGPLTADMIAGCLGSAGSVPPWDLTDAIDRRDPRAALNVLSRIMKAAKDAGFVHAILAKHVERLFLAQASGLTDEKALAKLLAVKGSLYPLKKAIQAAPRWGDTATAHLIVTQAGHHLRGGSAQRPEVTMQVLVGKLARRP
jgi:DNA polymerase-3 subunit delta